MGTNNRIAFPFHELLFEALMYSVNLSYANLHWVIAIKLKLCCRDSVSKSS